MIILEKGVRGSLREDTLEFLFCACLFSWQSKMWRWMKHDRIFDSSEELGEWDSIMNGFGCCQKTVLLIRFR